MGKIGRIERIHKSYQTTGAIQFQIEKEHKNRRGRRRIAEVYSSSAASAVISDLIIWNLSFEAKTEWT
jgi:hypothetical protein